MSHLLLIDDDDNFRKMLRTALDERGYEVTEASDGKEGLARYKARPVDLVISDLIMPEKEGLETIIELRKLQPGLKIIAMSGGGRVSAKEYLPLAMQLGAARVLAKPFATDILASTIAELLGEN